MDRAFDILNSKSKYGRFDKQAVTPGRLDELKSIFCEFRDYLLTLEDAEHKPLFSSRRKTLVVGFICTFDAVLRQSQDLFVSGQTYFPTFRVSQDIIETLFSKIRRMNGHNNNPTSQGFKHALRRLVAKQAIMASKSGNCLDCNSTSGVLALEWSNRAAPIPDDKEISSDTVIDRIETLVSDSTKYQESILMYIAGYLVRVIYGKVKYETCALALIADDATSYSGHSYSSPIIPASYMLQDVIDQGGLIYATDAVQELCSHNLRVKSIVADFEKGKIYIYTNILHDF